MDLPPANMSMPAPVDPKNVYAGAGAGMFSPAVAGQLSRVYSPNLTTGKVDVIDPETFKVIESLDAIRSPEHIVPSWDLQTLWVSGDISYARRPRRRDADRPEDRQARRRRSTCPIPTTCISPPTASRRSSSPRRCGGSNSAIPHTMALQGYIDDAEMRGHQPRRFLARRLLRDLHLRIQRRARQDRSRPSHARRDAAVVAPAISRRTSASRPTARPSSSPT